MSDSTRSEPGILDFADRTPVRIGLLVIGVSFLLLILTPLPFMAAYFIATLGAFLIGGVAFACYHSTRTRVWIAVILLGLLFAPAILS